MPKNITLFLLLLSSVFADYYDGNIYDDVDTNISMSIKSSLSNTPTDTNVRFDDFNKTTSISQDNAGIDQYEDYNLSNTTSAKQLLDKISIRASGRAQSVVQKMSESHPDFSNYSTTNLNELTNDSLQGSYTNSTRVSVIQDTKDTITTLLNKFGGDTVIKCYIKRSLSPSFYCPLPGKDSSYYTGGVANTKVEDSKESCDGYCQTQQSCISKSIAGFSDASPVTAVNLNAPFSKSFTLSDKQKLKSIELIVQGTSEQHRVYVLVEGTFEGKNIILLDNYELQLTKGIQAVELPLRLQSFSSVKVSFMTPYTFETSRKKRTLITASGAARLNSVKMHYESNKLWFCPATQFIKNRNECLSGRIISDTIGDTPVLLCVTKEDELREQMLGAYFSESGCVSECYSAMECVPTYRHLSNGITSSIYNVDYGCLSGADNTSCTKDLCKERIFSNIFPNNEVVYYNDDLKETTVMNGQAVEGTLRPIYNVAAEMTTNDDAQEKEKLMVSISKDMAYKSMLSNNTYVISKKVLNQSYPIQTKATVIGGNGVSIEYLPPSNLFNNGRNSYVYLVVGNQYNFKEETAGVNSIDGNIPATTYRSVNYTLLDSSHNKILFYIDNKTKLLDSNMTMFSTYSGNEKFSKMVDASGLLTDYDTAQLADYTIEEPYTTDRYTHNYLLSNAYLSDASSFSGTSLKRQATVGGKILKFYSGSLSQETGGTVFDYQLYVMISGSRLTYQDLIDKIESNEAHKAYSYSFSGEYTKDIKGHADINFEGRAVKLFMFGVPSKMSAIGEFVPELGDEGKEAFVFNFLYKDK